MNDLVKPRFHNSSIPGVANRDHEFAPTRLLRRSLRCFAGPLAVLGCAAPLWASTQPAAGSISVFTNRSAWEAAVGGLVVDDLSSEPLGSSSTPYNTLGNWGITSNSGSQPNVTVLNGGPNGSRSLDVMDFFPLDLSFAPPSPGGQAFGFDYSMGFSLGADDWKVLVSGMQVATIAPNATGFFGVLSTSSIPSFDILSPSDLIGGIALDDLSRAFDPCSLLVPDFFEENDSCVTAAVLVGGVLGLNVTATDPDWYSISVPAGADVVLEALFSHGDGDINLELYDGCGGTLLDSSTSSTDNELVAWSNQTGSTATVLLHAFMAAGSPSGCNSYDLELGIETPLDCVQPGDLSTAPVAPKILRHLTPKAWQVGDGFVEWNRDQAPKNRIDDLIDASPAGLHSVAVNYSRPTTAADSSFIDGLSGASQVDLVCRVITSIYASGLSYGDLQAIAAQPGVAFVEIEAPMTLNLGTALESVGVTSGFHSPDTLEDCYPGITGSGVTIAIIDTGVDNGTHQTFNGAFFVGGYNDLNRNNSLFGFEDPDDLHGHGTAIASAALGRGAGALSRGVANGANLVDIKFSDGSGVVFPKAIVRCIEVLYDKQSEWNVDIMNISVGTTTDSDGLGNLPQLVDLGAELGILCVTAMGNTGPGYTGVGVPASSTLALTVAASNDNNNPASIQTLYGFTAPGPRASDNDLDDFDELKPDVTAPGTNLNMAAHNSAFGTVNWSGTSFSAAIVSGLAALLLEQNPGMTPAALKQSIISSATPMGTPTLPLVDPNWNEFWGHGLIDAKAAFDSFPKTDLGFPSHPPAISWKSPDLTTDPTPVKVNQVAEMKALITNHGPNDAFGVKVLFGIHDYTGVQPPYFNIGTAIVDSINVGDTIEVSVPWVPLEVGHQCLKVEIVYGGECDPTDNKANKNLNVANSPITGTWRNFQSETQQNLFMSVTCDGPNADQWTVSVDPPVVILGANDGPLEVEFLARPALHLQDGDEITVNVATRLVNFGVTELGGMSFIVRKKDCNGNSTDDYFDILNGTSLDLNENGIPDECDPDAVAYGFCTGGPCGNDDPTAGCQNSTGQGAVLSALGSTSVANDDLVLEMSQLPPNKFGLLFNAPNMAGGIPFGDGLRVATGSPNRFPVLNSGPGGVISFGPVVGHTLANFQPAQQIQPGSQWQFQGWYRDPQGPCGGGFNLTHGLSVSFTP